MQKLLLLIDHVSTWVGQAFSWLVVGLTLLISWEVISRRLFDSPNAYTFDIMIMLYGALFMMAGAYTLGGGAAATMGRDADGRLIFPAVALWAFVPGIRAIEPKRGRDRLINFLVSTFEEVVYI